MKGFLMPRPTQTPEKLENDYDYLSERIKGFKNLPVDWDSNGSYPSSERVVNKALQIAHDFAKEKKPYIRVFPCHNEDDIQFEYDVNYKCEKIEIEFTVPILNIRTDDVLKKIKNDFNI